ncbi:MAG TPA: hypothetical protein VGF12_09255, partial [Roseateles sp.]|uniref:hypothetical protein n=1 Tax=Roseateles sp. TaxID=1971397 RepID=UPI002EDA531D
MRTFSLVSALIVGFIFWRFTSTLSGGVASLGKVGPADAAIFLTPIVLFALPLSAIAAIRSSPLISLWICAVAPLFGLCNIVLTVALSVRGASASSRQGWLLAFLWLLLLVLAIAAMARHARQAKVGMNRSEGEATMRKPQPTDQAAAEIVPFFQEDPRRTLDSVPES